MKAVLPWLAKFLRKIHFRPSSTVLVGWEIDRLDGIDQDEDDQTLKLLSNQIRRTVLLELAQKNHQRFSELMRLSQLDPNNDTGLFLYHVNRLSRAGVIQVEKGCYQITEKGQAIAKRLSLLTQESINRGGLMEVQDEPYSQIDWQAYRTPLPKIEIEPADEEFRLKTGSVIGGVGPGRTDLLDVVDIDSKGLPCTRFPSQSPVLMKKYAMPEGELYAFALQRFTGVTRIGGEMCVEGTKTFHDPDGVMLAKTIQWLTRRETGIYLKRQVSIDLHNNKPASTQESELLYTPLPIIDHPSKTIAQGTYRIRINDRRELALKLVSETGHDRKWEDYPTNTDLSVGKMYILEETAARKQQDRANWELAEIYTAQKID